MTKANSVKSKLFSPSDIQRIMKKAMVERMKQSYKKEWFPEDGAPFLIRVSIMKDEVTVGLVPGGRSTVPDSCVYHEGRGDSGTGHLR